MKNAVKTILFAVFILAGMMVTSSNAQQARRLNDGAFLIDNFREDSVGYLPAGWYNRDGDIKIKQLDAEGRARYHYKVKESDGNKFLRYEGMEAMHINFPLTNRHHKNIYHINVYKTPILSWKWRIFELPQGADVNDKNRNDAAASIYIVWDFGHVLFKKVPKTVRYVWGTSQPQGTTLSKFFGNQKIVVVETGHKDLGKWITFQRNIVKDYKQLFGDRPPKFPLAILILSDGDNTHSRVKADYDEIVLEPSESKTGGIK
jgi:hypothetical protein